ncbi:hypothetical protein [Clostridium tunisiense]|uniref:hypothetical protein n=1 Tax=Clostridium tunisiense TaxID=219748 RepID=UPI0002E69060|nr:hypothetical protein [Clostridium tunisiense]
MFSKIKVCPYCKSQKFDELKTDENKIYSLVQFDVITGRQSTATPITLYGCRECGLLTLQCKGIDVTED